MRIKVPEDSLVKVYELRDPRDLECKPRYVGITTKSLNYRLSAHLTQKSLVTKTHKNNWIKELLSLGLSPTIHLIEEVVGWTYACEVEKYWIKEFRTQGYKLVNTTDGGEGSVGIIPRQETRDKLSKTSSGKNNPMYGKSGKDSPVWGRSHTEDEKNRIRAAHIKAAKTREKSDGFGLSYSKKWNRWSTGMHINGVKYALGIYGKKKDAEAVINELYLLRKNEESPSSELIYFIIKRHKDVEWCRKLLIKPPSVIYKSEFGRWMVRISDGKKRHHLGLFYTKEEGEIAYKNKANELIMNILNVYNIKLEDI